MGFSIETGPPGSILPYIEQASNRSSASPPLVEKLLSPPAAAAKRGAVAAKQMKRPLWKKTEATEEELQRFKKSYFHEGKLGGLGKLIYPQSYLDSLYHREVTLIFHELNMRMRESKSDKNGLTLMEREAIKLYTDEHFRLINGSLDLDATNLELYRKHLSLSVEGMKETRKIVAPVLIKVLASALNKLPSFKGQLYRGDAVEASQLKKWKRERKGFVAQKFLSCSAVPKVCKGFALESRADYEEERGGDYRPVLYIIESKSAKEISDYSYHAGEDEKLYFPGQRFKIYKIDDTRDIVNIFLVEAA